MPGGVISAGKGREVGDEHLRVMRLDSARGDLHRTAALRGKWFGVAKRHDYDNSHEICNDHGHELMLWHDTKGDLGYENGRQESSL